MCPSNGYDFVTSCIAAFETYSLEEDEYQVSQKFDSGAMLATRQENNKDEAALTPTQPIQNQEAQHTIPKVAAPPEFRANIIASRPSDARASEGRIQEGRCRSSVSEKAAEAELQRRR